MQDTGAKVVTVTNTPRPGETAEQTAARSAPRNAEYPKARLAFVSQPTPGVYLLNLDDGEKFIRVEISNKQFGNLVADGARWLHQARMTDLEGVECRR